MNMKNLAGCLQKLLALVFMVTPLLAQAQEHDKTLEELSVHGKWNVGYIDKHLGTVKGRALIDEYENTALVIFTEPKSEERYILISRSYKREGKKITIEFEGAQPARFYNDGKYYPQQHITVPENTRKVEAKYGANKVSKGLAPRTESDFEKLTVELTITDFNTLRGTWRFRADPFTKRDTNGGGRFNTFELQQDGAAFQKGPETWIRPRPVIGDTFVLQDQLSYLGGFSDLATYSYFLPENSSRTKTNYRTLVIFGENLPQSPRHRAVFKSDSESIAYTAVRYGERIKDTAYGRNVLSPAKKKLLKLYPKLESVVDKLDYIIVQANLKDDVLPGDHSFTMNGVDSAWRLKYGDNHASINFVRKIRPTSAGALVKDQKATYEAYKRERVERVVYGAEDSEATLDVFLPETIYIEVRTNVVLDVDTIHVLVGKKGDILIIDSETNTQKINSKNPKVPAYRVPGRPKVYRTKPIQLIKAGNSTNTILGLKIVANSGDSLAAVISQPGLISLEPKPAIATVRLTPGQKEVGALFKDALFEATACVNFNVRRKKRTGRKGLVGWDIEEEIKIDDWNKLPFQKIARVSRRLVFQWRKLSTTIQLGDYAAMILLRQQFMRLMENKIKHFKDTKRRASVLALRHALEPHVLDLDHFIGDVIVPGSKKGKTIFFSETYRTSNRSNSYGRDSKSVPDWVIKATREALAHYVKIMQKSLEQVRDIKPCEDLIDLLLMTGRSFNAVAQHLKPRLMTLQDEQGRFSFSWVPDYWARTRVWNVAHLAQRVKTFDELSSTDTKLVYSAAAIVSIPFAVWGGISGIVAAIVLEVADVSHSIVDSFDNYFKSQAEIKFARGAIEIIGYERLTVAKAEEFSRLKLVVTLGYTVFAETAGEIFGAVILAPILKWARRWPIRSIINALRIRSGRKLFAKYDFDIDKVPAGLGKRNYRDMLAYMVHAKRLGAGGPPMNAGQSKVYKHLNELEAETKASPKPGSEVDDLLLPEIKDLYYRKDILYLMRDARSTVAAALRSDPAKALRILRHSPRLTKEGFERAFNGQLYGEPVMRGRDAYETPSAARTSDEVLEAGGWWFEIDASETLMGSMMASINVKTKNASGIELSDNLIRDFNSDTGTFTMVNAERRFGPSKMDIGIPNAPAPDGWPTFLFAQLRFMNKVGIRYAGEGGEPLRLVVMDTVTNARTNAQLAWFQQTKYPGRSIEELNQEGLLGEFLKDTRSVQYARSVINTAGYRITDVRLSKSVEGPDDFRYFDFKVGKDGETWEQFLKRYNLSEHSKAPFSFDIHIKVEPHTASPGKTSVSSNPPSKSPDGPGRPGGGRDPNETQIFPEFKPPSDLPASVIDARRQADRLFNEAEETYGKVLSGERKLPTDPAELEKELARLNGMVRARNLQYGIEAAVREAQELGIPESEINGILDRHMTGLGTNPKGARADTLLYLQSSIRKKQGYHVVDIKESEALNGMLARAQLGTSTDADIQLLSQKISEVNQQGRDFFDDLSRTGTNNAFTQKTLKNLYERDFELLTNKQGIDKLRELARQKNLLPGKGDSPEPGSADYDLDQGLTTMREQARQDIKNNQSDAQDRLDRLDRIKRQMGNFKPEERHMISNAVQGMRNLGVSEFEALDYASRNLRDLAARNDNPADATAQLVAEGIMKHGTRRISMDAFVEVIAAISRGNSQKAHEEAAKRLGFAPLPSEIRPGWLYPP